MTSEEAFYIKSDPKRWIDITSGPNDWDMWLCLRKTYKEVSFYVNEAIVTYEGRTPKTFFSGTVTSLKKSEKIWIVDGLVSEFGVSCAFHAEYSPDTRKGKVRFF